MMAAVGFLKSELDMRSNVGPSCGRFTLVYGCFKGLAGLPLFAISAMSADMAWGRVTTL